MTRVKSFVFLLLAPGSAVVLVPWLLQGRWGGAAAWPPGLLGTVLGVALMAAGVPVLLDCFLRFSDEGQGTPAPIEPPRRLVVRGLYRRVRNPMYVAVLAVVLGEALALGSGVLVAWAALLFATFHTFVVCYEEPTLRRTFGADYERFCAEVPRWVPRIRLPPEAPPV